MLKWKYVPVFNIDLHIAIAISFFATVYIKEWNIICNQPATDRKVFDECEKSFTKDNSGKV